MNRLSYLAVLAAAFAAPALSQATNPFVGRWDLTLTGPRGSWPQWMEIVQQDGKLDGRIQPQGGSVRPIVEAKMEGDRLLIVVSKATEGYEVTGLAVDIGADFDPKPGLLELGELAVVGKADPDVHLVGPAGGGGDLLAGLAGDRVGATAGRERHDDADGLGRPCLRKGAGAQAQGGQREGRREDGASLGLHAVSIRGPGRVAKVLRWV